MSAIDRDNMSSNAASWVMLALLALWLAALEFIAPVPIALRGLIPMIGACGTLGFVAHYYRAIRPVQEFEAMCVSLAQVLLFSGIGICLSYLVARNDGPLWDATLESWDKAIGFDWIAMMQSLDRSPLTVKVLSIAYTSLIPQIIIVVCALGFMRRIWALRTLMLGAMLCGSVCIFISRFMPADAYGVYYDIRPGDFRHVFPHAGFIKMPDLDSLRAGTIPVLDFAKMHGIITFPSYHGGLSAVTLWGFWVCRFNWIRIPGIAAASLTIAATPVDGGHYLVDVIAGVAIAAVCVAIAGRAVLWRPSLDWLKSLPFRHLREASAR